MNQPQIFFENVTSMYTHLKTFKSIPIGTEIYVPKTHFCIFHSFFFASFSQKFVTFDRKIPDPKFWCQIKADTCTFTDIPNTI